MLDEPILMNGQIMTLGEIIFHMNNSPKIRWAFTVETVIDYSYGKHQRLQYNIYDNPRGPNYFYVPQGDRKFTISSEYGQIYVNDEILDESAPLFANCVAAIDLMDKQFARWGRCLRRLTYGNVLSYQVDEIRNDEYLVSRGDKSLYLISSNGQGGYYMNITAKRPIQPYNIPLATQSFHELLSHRTR